MCSVDGERGVGRVHGWCFQPQPIRSLADVVVVWYGILEFNVPLDTVWVISETGWWWC